MAHFYSSENLTEQQLLKPFARPWTSAVVPRVSDVAVVPRVLDVGVASRVLHVGDEAVVVGVVVDGLEPLL
jgi:hypothetical protein